ncbi:ATP-binding cassette transporter [Chloropicon roscoffensis]|uniref:ATP-binding cassette transporter n=2 Tax=Chloropicon roscoffensis TaxID=1461544 RepID=A0AAX4P1C6_9CHLO
MNVMGEEERAALLSVRRRHTTGSVAGSARRTDSVGGLELQPSVGVTRRTSTRNGRDFLRHSRSRNPSYTTIPVEEVGDRTGEGRRRSTANSTKPLALKALEVILPYYTSEERRLAVALVCTVLVLAAGHTSLSVVTSYAERDLTTALATKDQPEFFQAIVKFVGIIILAVPLQAGYYYVREILTLRWRTWLTSHLMDMYFSNDSYYRLKVGQRPLDNPDQRICEDAAAFTTRVVDLSLTLFKYTISTVSFIGILWTIAPELVIVLSAYASIGTYTSVKLFGRKLAALAYDTSLKEGNLRYGLVRVQEHTESIAFLGSASIELNIVLGMLADVVEVLSNRIKWDCKLEVYSSIYSYLTILLPTLVVSPRYFRGEIELGVVTQAAIAFSRIMDAASIVVDNLGSVSSLNAEIVRLHDLLQAMGKGHRAQSDSLQTATQGADGGGSSIQVKEDLDEKGHLMLRVTDLSLRTPPSNLRNKSHSIIDRMTWDLRLGHSVLIAGAPGTGKSTLLRAIAGLWTYGGGEIRTLRKRHMMFLPQRPYLVLGTLMQQLLYARGCNEGTPFTVKDARDALEKSNLSHLEAKASFDGEEINWENILSVGESQKLAFARLFVKRPKVAFLDESTSAIGAQEEEDLYRNLQSLCKTYVSVGHRMTLVKYHTHVLQLEARGGWKMYESKDFTCPSRSASDHF